MRANHMLAGQRLYADHLVLVNQACRQLVQAVSALVGDLRVDPGLFQACLVAILGSFLLAGEVALRVGETTLAAPQVRGIGERLPPLLNTATSLRPTSTPTLAFTTGSAWVSS